MSQEGKSENLFKSSYQRVPLFCKTRGKLTFDYPQKTCAILKDSQSLRIDKVCTEWLSDAF